MGKLYSWGQQANGRLGNGVLTSTGITTPGQRGSDTDWDQISAGDRFSLGIKSGALYSWGSAANGQLGNGTVSGDVATPTLINSDTNWQHISAGYRYALAIKGGALYAWGSPTKGCLGNNNTTNIVTTPVQIGTNTSWTSVSAGVSLLDPASAGIAGGKLFTWGSATGYVLGNGLTTPNVLVPTQIGLDEDWHSVSVGTSFMVAIKTTGEIYSWGSSGAWLGDGNGSTSITSPTRIGSDSDWSKIAAGRADVLAIKTNGQLYGWGENYYGEIGDNSSTRRTAPVLVNSSNDWTHVALSYVAAGVKGGQLYTWGQGSAALGNGTTTPDVKVPTRIGTASDWSTADVYDHVLATTVSAPANTAAPTLSGTFRTGQSVSTSNGSWSNSPTSYSYQWSRATTSGGSYSNISGATSSSYTIASGDAGYYLKCEVTATNGGGSTAATSAASTQVTELPTISSPSISGTERVGQTLTASASSTAGYPAPSLSYQWQRSVNAGSTWNAISGQTATTYELQAADRGNLVRVQATATNSEGSDTQSSLATAAIEDVPINTAIPQITYTDEVLQVGTEITLDKGTWTSYPVLTSGQYTYELEKSDNGSTGWDTISTSFSGTTLNVPSEVAGKYLRLRVTADNGLGTAVEAYSVATGYISEDPVSVVAPTIYGGEAKVEETVYCDPGTWTGFPEPDFSYNWQSSDDGSTGWTTIGGANTGTFQITEDLAEKWIRCLVQGSNDAGEVSAASAPFGPVEAPGGATAAIIGAIGLQNAAL